MKDVLSIIKNEIKINELTQNSLFISNIIDNQNKLIKHNMNFEKGELFSYSLAPFNNLFKQSSNESKKSIQEITKNKDIFLIAIKNKTETNNKNVDEYIYFMAIDLNTKEKVIEEKIKPLSEKNIKELYNIISSLI